MDTPTAAILVIGDEILSGKTPEANARFLIAALRNLGIKLRRIVVVPDEIPEIAQTLRELATAFTYVFTSGGVGPTHDDVTLKGICQAFDTQLERQPEIEAMLREYLGPQLQESHLRMADVPQGATLIYQPDLRWPVMCYQNVYILPGIPELFRQNFLAIQERFRTTAFCLQQIYTLEDEFMIAEQLHQLAANHPTVNIGSYPSLNRQEYRVKITLESKDEPAVMAALADLQSLLNPELIVSLPEVTEN
jgi:molybdenum cofactor synthesis domain-containing protein